MIIYEDVFVAFQKQKVKYVVVGGIAVNLLGSLRSTADLDIMVELEDKNLAKIVTILKRLGYCVKQPVDPMVIADKKIRETLIKKQHMKALNFFKKGALNEVDIIVDSAVSFKAARKSAIIVKVGKIEIPVISIGNLIKMKKNISRPVDKFDVAELKRLKKLKKK